MCGLAYSACQLAYEYGCFSGISCCSYQPNLRSGGSSNNTGMLSQLCLTRRKYKNARLFLVVCISSISLDKIQPITEWVTYKTANEAKAFNKATQQHSRQIHRLNPRRNTGGQHTPGFSDENTTHLCPRNCCSQTCDDYSPHPPVSLCACLDPPPRL